MITKPDLGGGVSHPARYSDKLLPVFARMLEGATNILDPMAGTGRIHELREYGYGFNTWGVEIEPEWADMHRYNVVGDALDLPYEDNTFDAVCTSPTYGNRLADHHNAKDPSVRRTYKHDLGRDLHPHNSGAMQWGVEYRRFHLAAWKEVRRVLVPGGRFVLNVKDHVRGGQRQYVSGWHVTLLCCLGFDLLEHVDVGSFGMRAGSNNELRMPNEVVYLFKLSEKGRQ